MRGARRNAARRRRLGVAVMLAACGLLPVRMTHADEPKNTSGSESDGPSASQVWWNLLEIDDRARPHAQAGVGPEQAEVPEEGPPELEVDLGGALRFNLFWKSWDAPATIRASGNDVAFDTFRLEVNSSYGRLRMSAEYRFYAGYNMLHHGWLGYRFAELADVQVGVIRAPFGLLPYASHNYFFSIAYYVGLEDDYDLGMRSDFDVGPFEIQLAYFRNDEGSYSGSSIDSARYSYDVVRSDPSELGSLSQERPHEETNQGNVRLAYTLEHGDVGFTELGVSGQLGQLESRGGSGSGLHWATAVHLHGSYGPVDVQLEGARYGYDQDGLSGQGDAFVVMGAYDAPYRVASEAYVTIAGLAYRWDVDWGILESLTFYEDVSWLHKVRGSAGFLDTVQTVTGVLVHAGPVFTYIDAVIARHHPWIGGSYASALTEGNQGSAWHTRLNVNVGYYF